MNPSRFIRLALKSLFARRGSAVLSILSIAVSTALVVSVDKIRRSAQSGFESTVSGVDLIVGARTSPTSLLLFSVFGIGAPSTNVSWGSYRLISSAPAVAWSAPLALGDSHRGFRVVGTTQDFFEHYRFGAGRALEFGRGRTLQGRADAVIGANVARSLGYEAGDDLVIAHGLEHAKFAEHGDHPFTIVGVLRPTGTPTDRSIFVSLEGLDAVHDDFPGSQDHGRAPNAHSSNAIPVRDDHPHEEDHQHRAHANEAGQEDNSQSPDDPAASDNNGGRPISAFLLGLKSRAAALSFQRAVNTHEGEALLAALPAIALAELWSVVSQVEAAFIIVAIAAVLCALAGLLASLLAGMNERRREIAIYRAMGASPAVVAALLVAEAGMLAGAGALIGAGVANFLLISAEGFIEIHSGATLGDVGPSSLDLILILVMTAAGSMVGVAPAMMAYFRSLSDGLSSGA